MIRNGNLTWKNEDLLPEVSSGNVDRSLKLSGNDGLHVKPLDLEELSFVAHNIHLWYTRSWSHRVTAFAAGVNLILQDHASETRKDPPTKS